MLDDRAAQRAQDQNTVLRLMQRATGGRLLVLRVVIVLVLLMAAQVYDGSLHALSHWFILGLYAAGSVWFGRAERGEGRHAEGFAWAGTGLNAGLAIYVLVEHMLAGAADDGGAADAVSRLPAFLLLLQTALSMRVWHAALFSGTVVFAWGAAILVGLVNPAGFLGPHVDLGEQVPGLLTFLAASVVVVDGVARLRHAAGEAVRLEHERTQLARFVPDGVATELARDGDLGTARRRHACLLALDVRGFSRLSREHPPEAMVRALLAIRALAHAAVTEHDGIVDKYVGDAVLAQFVVGGPVAQARGALACARAIRTRLSALNRTRAEAGDFPLRVVVALHAGDLLVGVFDDGLRAEYTVLGPAMNTLARLETRAKAADLDVAASEDFLRLLGPALPDGARAVPVAEAGALQPPLFAIADAAVPADA
ncbi:adenylate/guanylate cyclase domain-containing protein [Methylobacterium sp. WL6]|uniref:adenylate/guanylate cyclase domain-containing protein n=1 Tax=Methylobacterium sp. WL6 TaxID=2603901 RepID=UPI0011CB0336|nr:adenylate/guanylate cyclase domain-containing protein [Methylobacterium sp. WL6]TXN66209.1 adenylate/guanylate cyclase domain-containing protein [Methylobacterium sp. WL6]